MTDYTPTTEDMREYYQGTWFYAPHTNSEEEKNEEFDRFLEDIIQKAKAQGWDECGEKLYGNLLYPETETYLRNPYRGD